MPTEKPQKGIVGIAEWLADHALVREAEESRLVAGVELGTSDDLARRFRHHVRALQLLMQRAHIDVLTIDEQPDRGVTVWLREAANGAVCETLDDVELYVRLALERVPMPG